MIQLPIGLSRLKAQFIVPLPKDKEGISEASFIQSGHTAEELALAARKTLSDYDISYSGCAGGDNCALAKNHPLGHGQHHAAMMSSQPRLIPAVLILLLVKY